MEGLIIGYKKWQLASPIIINACAVYLLSKEKRITELEQALENLINGITICINLVNEGNRFKIIFDKKTPIIIKKDNILYSSFINFNKNLYSKIEASFFNPS